MYIDSHCHLNHEMITEAGTPEELVRNANENNIVGMTSICCEIVNEFPQLLSIVKPMQNVWCTVGTHPLDASNDSEKTVTTDDIIRLANSDDKVIGIGESGLDYFYDVSTKSDQQKSFRHHIQACQETGLPLVIHAREADDDIMMIIKEEIKNSPKPLRAVLHCFSSGEAMMHEGLDLGFYVSFSGMITFKKMQWLRDMAVKVPLDKLLIETDAPFLAPMPNRGKTNQPAYVEYVALELAKMHNLTREEIGKQTMDNFFNLFPKALKTWVEPANS